MKFQRLVGGEYGETAGWHVTKLLAQQGQISSGYGKCAKREGHFQFRAGGEMQHHHPAGGIRKGEGRLSRREAGAGGEEDARLLKFPDIGHPQAESARRFRQGEFRRNRHHAGVGTAAVWKAHPGGLHDPPVCPAEGLGSVRQAARAAVSLQKLAGIGFVLARGVLLDVAYQYLSSKTTDYYLFYVEDSEGMAESARYATTFNRHNVAVTLGFRF